LFGREYRPAATALAILALSIGVVFLHWVVSSLLIAAGRTRLYAGMQGGSAALNVALNLYLIPRFGISGAAVATLGAELALLASGVVVLRRGGIFPSLVPLLAPLGA